MRSPPVRPSSTAGCDGGRRVLRRDSLIGIPAALLIAWNGNRPWWLATYIFVGCVISALSAAAMRRTSEVPLLATAPGG